MSEPSKLVQATGAMGLATLASRVLGLAREIVFAAFLGQSLVASAFFFAFQIPNLFRRLLGEGALTAAFIPVFTEKLTKEGAASGQRAANLIGTSLCVVACGVTATVIAVLALASFLFPLSAKTRFILSLTQWMMPYLVFVCMAALSMAVLNARRHFFVPALSPILLNIVMIGSVYLFCPRFGHGLQHQVYGLVLGVLLGGLVQWLYQLPWLWREGFAYRWDFQPKDPVVRRVAGLMWPSVLGVAVFQVNVISSGALAFWVGDYARAALNYADRLMELPMGIFGVSVATYALPTLATLFAQDKIDEFNASLDVSLRLLWFVTIPAAIGLMVLSEPIVALLFERGNFGPTETKHAAFALFFLAPGLVSYATVNVVARAFYAMQDTRTPMKIGVMAMVVNVFLAFALMWPLKEGGLALANTLSSSLNAISLFVALRRRIPGMGGRQLVASALRTAAPSVMMGIVCWITWKWVSGRLQANSFLSKCELALVPMVAALAVFILVAGWMGASEWTDVLAAFRRNKIRK